MLLRLRQFAYLQLRYSLPGIFPGLGRNDFRRDIEINGGGIAPENNVNRLRMHCAHNLYVLMSRQIPERAHFDFIISKCQVDEYPVGVALDRLKQANVIGEIREIQSHGTLDVSTLLLREDMEDEHSSSRSGVVARHSRNVLGISAGVARSVRRDLGHRKGC